MMRPPAYAYAYPCREGTFRSHSMPFLRGFRVASEPAFKADVLEGTRAGASARSAVAAMAAADQDDALDLERLTSEEVTVLFY